MSKGSFGDGLLRPCEWRYRFGPIKQTGPLIRIHQMRMTIALVLAALAGTQVANTQSASAETAAPGPWQIYDAGDIVIGWGSMTADGMLVEGSRFTLSKVPQASFMGDVSWMSHGFTLNCLNDMFTQRAGEYLALDGSVLGAMYERPMAAIEPGSFEELIKIAVCDGRPIEGTKVDQTRDEALKTAAAMANSK
jgi:hypothetical protein